MTKSSKKPIKTKTADNLFSKDIRNRDGMCMRCFSTTKALDCSHYWKRGDSGTRFDPKNCIALCRDCHTYWERRKNYEYREFMIAWLGRTEYDLLEIRARTNKPRYNAVLEFMEARKDPDYILVYSR